MKLHTAATFQNVTDGKILDKQHIFWFELKILSTEKTTVEQTKKKQNCIDINTQIFKCKNLPVHINKV
jgi:hypothetical protein